MYENMIQVYRKDTGEKVTVPSHWQDVPVLWAPFRKTPLQKANEQKPADVTTAKTATKDA